MIYYVAAGLIAAVACALWAAFAWRQLNTTNAEKRQTLARKRERYAKTPPPPAAVKHTPATGFGRRG